MLRTAKHQLSVYSRLIPCFQTDYENYVNGCLFFDVDDQIIQTFSTSLIMKFS